MSKITVYSSSPYVIEAKKAISFQELKAWIRSGKIFLHLFRYRESLLLAYDVKLLSKPFAGALLMRFLSRGKTLRQDSKGTVQRINFSLLSSLFFKLIKDFFRKGKFLQEIEREVSLQLASLKSKTLQPFDLSKPPLYLRTDFCFGLQSGGSVTHIAGVLNHLSHFTGSPIFLTTDPIPTVDPKWESHTILPGDSFWDFREMPPLHFNQIFLQRALQAVGARQPSFIYQRYSLNNFSGVQLAKHYRVPFVLEFNGSEIWVSRNWGGTVLKYEPLVEQIELLNLRASDLIVVVSQPLKEELIAKGIDPEKILVNPNGVNPAVYAPEVDGTKVRKKYQLEGKIVLGFIGTFGKWHGAEVLAEAFGQLLDQYPELRKRVRLLLIGDGITLPLVKETLRKGNVSECAILTGTVPQEEGPAHLAACDLLVASHVPNPDKSPFFGSPTKLFEYMAMGKAIVASDLDQIGEILKHGTSAWMVRPGDANSLMQGLKTLIDDPALREKLGASARKEVCERYTWKEHTRKIIEALSRIV